MYKLKSQYYSAHKQTTQVTIEQDNPYRYIEEELTGDVTGLQEQEIVQLVLDKLVAEVAPSHAINKLDERTTELDTKLSEVDTKVAEVDSFMVNAKETMEEIKQQSAITQGALIEMIEMVGALQTKPPVAPAEENSNEESKEDSTNTEEPLEGGDDSDGNATSN